MKGLLKAIFIYAIITMFISLLFSFFIALISFLFALADIIVISVAGGPNYGDPSNGGIIIASNIVKAILAGIMIIGLVKLATAIVPSIQNSIGKMITQSTSKLGKMGMKDAGNRLKKAAKNMNARDFRSVGNMARRRGWNSLSRAAYGVGDAGTLSGLLKKGLTDGNKGKVDDENNTDESEVKSNDDVREAKIKDREDNAKKQEEIANNKEEQEKRELQGKYASPEEQRDIDLNDRDKEVFDAFNSTNEGAFESLTDADIPGMDGFEDAMNVSQNSEETQNNYLGSSDARNDDANMADSNIGHLVESGIPKNMDNSEVSDRANILAERLGETADTSSGLSSEDLAGMEEAKQNSIARDEQGQALPSFAGDSISATGEALSRGVMPYGNVIPTSVTESGNYTPENIIQAAQPNMENYMNNIPQEFANSVQRIAEGQGNVASSIRPQEVALPAQMAMPNAAALSSEIGSAVAGAIAGSAIGTGIAGANNSNNSSQSVQPSSRETIANMSPDEFRNLFADNFARDISRDGFINNAPSGSNRQREVTLSKSTLDRIANAFAQTRSGNISAKEGVSRVSQYANKDISSSIGSTDEAEVKRAEDAQNQFKKSLEAALKRVEESHDELDKKRGSGVSKGRNNGKVD